jgi:hypothetical protein
MRRAPRGDAEEGIMARLRALLPKEVKSLSLDRLEADLAVLQASQQAQAQLLKHDPPVILFSTTPAMLIVLEGPPVYRPVSGTELERVFNTRALILRDKAGNHYLHLFDSYVEAPALHGPWTVAQTVPPR